MVVTMMTAPVVALREQKWLTSSVAGETVGESLGGLTNGRFEQKPFLVCRGAIAEDFGPKWFQIFWQPL